MGGVRPPGLWTTIPRFVYEDPPSTCSRNGQSAILLLLQLVQSAWFTTKALKATVPGRIVKGFIYKHQLTWNVTKHACRCQARNLCHHVDVEHENHQQPPKRQVNCHYFTRFWVAWLASIPSPNWLLGQGTQGHRNHLQTPQKWLSLTHRS